MSPTLSWLCHGAVMRCRRAACHDFLRFLQKVMADDTWLLRLHLAIDSSSQEAGSQFSPYLFDDIEAGGAGRRQPRGGHPVAPVGAHLHSNTTVGRRDAVDLQTGMMHHLLT